jgi:hypothetical protein
MNHQSIQMNSAAQLAPARLATSRLLQERALQANNRKPPNSPASSLPQDPLQRGTISNFCSPCGRLLAGDLSRANAAQQLHKKKVLQDFPGHPRCIKKRATSKSTAPSAARHHLKFLLTLWEAACRRSFPSKRSAAAA